HRKVRPSLFLSPQKIAEGRPPRFTHLGDEIESRRGTPEVINPTSFLHLHPLAWPVARVIPRHPASIAPAPGERTPMLRLISVSLSVLSALVATSLTTSVWAAPPVLYTQPAYESPVRGDPDDLLLLSGSGLSGADTVVYQAISNPLSPPAHPTSIP